VQGLALHYDRMLTLLSVVHVKPFVFNISRTSCLSALGASFMINVSHSCIALFAYQAPNIQYCAVKEKEKVESNSKKAAYFSWRFYVLISKLLQSE